MVSWSTGLHVALQPATSGMPVSDSVTNGVAHQPPVGPTPDFLMTNHDPSGRQLSQGCANYLSSIITGW